MPDEVDNKARMSYRKYFLTQLPGGVSSLYRLLSGFPEETTATAICTFAYSPGWSSPGILSEPMAPNVLLFQGRTEGHMVPARGSHEFGWDAAFEPCASAQADPKSPMTYAEMSKEYKNSISHRGKALAKVGQWITGE